MRQEPDLLTTQEVAELLGLQIQTVNVWRQRGRGPRFVKVGRLVRYRQQDVTAFIEKNSREQTKQSAAG